MPLCSGRQPARSTEDRYGIYRMAWRNGVPFAIIFTKADKQSAGKTRANVDIYLSELSKQWEELPPYFISSAEKKTGRKEILDYIEQINHSITKNHTL